MRHYASSDFWAAFQKSPLRVQRLARKQYRLLRENPRHPSLQFKPVLSGRYRSIRVSRTYRAIGVPVPDGVQWFWIGHHNDYDRLLK